MKGKSNENDNKNTEKDKKDKKDTIYNVSKIIKYYSIKYIKCRVQMGTEGDGGSKLVILSLK